MGSQALGARADGWHEDLDSVAAPTGSIDRLIMEVTVPSTTSIEDP